MGFDQLPIWAKKFNVQAHSPSGTARPTCLEFFDKAVARPRKWWTPANCAMQGGKAAEVFVRNVVVNGMDRSSAYREALALYDEHVSPEHLPNDADKASMIRDGVYAIPRSKDEKDSGVIEQSGTVFELTCQHLLEGTLAATAGANRVTDGRWCSLQLDGVDLDFIGEMDFEAGGVVETKTHWPFLAAETKNGFKINSLPAKPRPDHVVQVAFYRAWLQRQEEHVPVNLVYANCKGWRVFSSNDCEELSDLSLANALKRMRRVARHREKLMKTAESIEELLQLVVPEMGHFMWRDKPPEYLELARRMFDD